MNTKQEVVIFWFRRDLRLRDNAGLYHALKSEKAVLPLFIFDKEILDLLEEKADRRVDFIHKTIEALQSELEAIGSSLWVAHGNSIEVFKELNEHYTLKKIFLNHDYEPAAIERDQKVKNYLESIQCTFHSFKDQVIFEKQEIVKDDGSPYTVFTPYMKRWKAELTDFYLKSYPTNKYFSNFLKWKAKTGYSLKELGFEQTDTVFPPPVFNINCISNYQETRDFPALNGTSRMSLHLRFGTVSVRELTQNAIKLNEKWWNELIWREFYMMILFHFPHVVTSAFKKQYNSIPLRNNETEFYAWCNGKTGYPIVDAGMRELNATGFMHNRVRMIVASFLVKHLLIDWKWGEAYFAKKLLDFELSSNNGGWQWAASSGCDAAPYFRVFSPSEQTKKFDSQFTYIRKWIPELESLDYPAPIVDHKYARERVLKTYKLGLSKDGDTVM
ncbi:MAG: deoxyribodipyrimidine photo-lyase [Bacteroidetes bacterium]|nr:deoxyribodipyrimidine photo-lyase [Bacteroidota bacterium]